ncbi:MAG: transposase [Bacteroidota bacterium]
MKQLEHFFKQYEKFHFEEKFSTQEACLKVLADEKWAEGYQCRRCGHTNYCRGRSPYSRRCTRCKYEESAQAHTIFHKCRIPLPKAFKISFQVCNQHEISSYKLSEALELRQMTCWRFKKTILECIERHGGFQVEELEKMRKEER